jgi:transcriptional regulator with XRE-family HTH domain
MELSPQLCRAARALLDWTAEDLARAARIGITTVQRYEHSFRVRPSSTHAMLLAFKGARLEFIAAGHRSLEGGAGIRHLG